MNTYYTNQAHAPLLSPAHVSPNGDDTCATGNFFGRMTSVVRNVGTMLSVAAGTIAENLPSRKSIKNFSIGFFGGSTIGLIPGLLLGATVILTISCPPALVISAFAVPPLFCGGIGGWMLEKIGRNPC